MPSLLAELARRVVDDRPLDLDLVARQPAEWKAEMGWDK